ncbi:secernin-1 [Lutzomyia longipalpis]|uniref:secernin-1 n=1 Tax=Lutzomyia longipalpis TaxID=7200 RepID=UPI00248396FE|nr:secernin-1 [Lutzomyia longipalpis]
MPSDYGECFVVLQPFAENGGAIYGRNSYDTTNEVTEVLYFPAKDDDSGPKKCTAVEVDGAPARAVIFSAPASVGGGAGSGANDKGVAIGLCFAENEASDGALVAMDLVRLGLERGATACEAVEAIGALVEKYAAAEGDSAAPRSSFVVCDAKEAWFISVVGNLWAAEQITEGFRASPRGLNVTTKIDKCSSDLREKVQSLGVWDGSGELNFATCFGSSSTAEATFPINTPSAEAAFTLPHMFQLLRADDLHQDTVVSSHVSSLSPSGVSCHWFTATPNTRESVFKPFVFTANARISPLTTLDASKSDQTLLFKYHHGRNWAAVGNLLASLEETCVAEVKDVLATISDAEGHELDDLMKDCVEAEVKFYR